MKTYLNLIDSKIGQTWTAWTIAYMCLVTWPCEIAHIIVCSVGFKFIRVQVSYKAHLVIIFKLYLLSYLLRKLVHVLTLAQCSIIKAFTCYEVSWTSTGVCMWRMLYCGKMHACVTKGDHEAAKIMTSKSALIIEKGFSTNYFYQN